MEYFIGFFGGIISGFFGGGGGMIIHPAMTKILKIDEYKARGTTIITILPAVLFASFFYVNNNYINWKLAYKVVLGGVIGGYLGAKIMKKIPKLWLSLSFDIFIIIISIKMIIQG